MPYDRLTGHLAGSGSPTVTTLPDGSIDYYCTLDGGGGQPLETRESLGREVLGDRTALAFRVETTEPGGQAVNAAKQLHACGGNVTCYGHLDDSVFESLPFETVSMGDPSLVYVFNFEDRDLMLVRNADVAEWTLENLQRVSTLPEVFAEDAICCTNWASLPGLEDAFHQLSDVDVPRVPFVFDPGDIVGGSPADINALLDALAALQDTFDVIYNANRQEIRATARPLSGPFGDETDRLVAIREATGISAAVMHARDEAVVATRDGRTRVENYRVARPERHTGAGDRFTGGLCHALACGWDWDVALACGNTCAVYYVESGDTGTVDELIDFIERRIPPES